MYAVAHRAACRPTVIQQASKTAIELSVAFFTTLLGPKITQIDRNFIFGHGKGCFKVDLEKKKISSKMDFFRIFSNFSAKIGPKWA